MEIKLSELIFQNFFTYDWIIFLAAGIDLIVFFISNQTARSLYNSVLPRIHVSSRYWRGDVDKAREGVTYSKIMEKWQRSEFFYNLFGNITATFTLLGILGTVLALLRLMGRGLDQSVNLQFMAALTSTFWGIIFTIIFRVLDSAISYHVDIGGSIVELIQKTEIDQRDDIS